jgi:hypothetical protein
MNLERTSDAETGLKALPSRIVFEGAELIDSVVLWDGLCLFSVSPWCLDLKHLRFCVLTKQLLCILSFYALLMVKTAVHILQYSVEYNINTQKHTNVDGKSIVNTLFYNFIKYSICKDLNVYFGNQFV